MSSTQIATFNISRVLVRCFIKIPESRYLCIFKVEKTVIVLAICIQLAKRFVGLDNRVVNDNTQRLILLQRELMFDHCDQIRNLESSLNKVPSLNQLLTCTCSGLLTYSTYFQKEGQVLYVDLLSASEWIYPSSMQYLCS